jgi:two-component system, sensor histidine kinase and response regulator
MLCWESTFQDSSGKLARIEVTSEVNKLVSKDSMIERFVDLPDLLARVENDHELLAELFAMFQAELPTLQDALRHATDTGDLHQIAKAAHTLKGMLANMSIKHGASLAANIEAAARSSNMPTIKVTLAALDIEIANLTTAIDAFVAGM